jgi:hypothetical protein
MRDALTSRHEEHFFLVRGPSLINTLEQGFFRPAYCQFRSNIGAISCMRMSCALGSLVTKNVRGLLGQWILFLIATGPVDTPNP